MDVGFPEAKAGRRCLTQNRQTLTYLQGQLDF